MHYVMTFTNQINQQPGKFTPNRQCRVAFRVISMAKKQVFTAGHLYLRNGTCWKETVFLFGISGVRLVKNGYLHENPPQMDNAGWLLNFEMRLRNKFFTASRPYISETVHAGRKRSSFLESAGSN